MQEEYDMKILMINGNIQAAGNGGTRGDTFYSVGKLKEACIIFMQRKKLQREFV